MKFISICFVFVFHFMICTKLVAGILVPVKGKITGFDDSFVEFKTSKNLFRVKRSELDSFLNQKTLWKNEQVANLSLPVHMVMVKTTSQRWVPLISLIDIK